MKIKNPLYDYLVQLIKEKNEDVLKILSDGIRIGTITEYVKIGRASCRERV